MAFRECRGPSAGPICARAMWTRPPGSTAKYLAGRLRRARTTVPVTCTSRTARHSSAASLQRNFCLDSSGYLHIKNGEAFIGGIPPAQFLPPNVPPHWMLYYYVTDVDASTKRLQELGGAVHMGPMTMEKVGPMSVVAVPQGASFPLFTPAPP